jgi:hypothetical protein
MYTALIQPDPRFDKNNNKLLKLKIPLRIKVFGWYLWKRILTKDNFAKKKWHGSKKCVFLSPRKCLFFRWRFAGSRWSVIQLASTLYLPCSVANIFGNWIHGIDLRFKKHIRVARLP